MPSKQAKQLMPNDGRKYKNSVVKQVLSNHTFKPKIYESTQNLAKMRKDKILEKLEKDDD